MRARVKSGNLPDVPHYTGRTGKPTGADWEIAFDDYGHILRCVERKPMPTHYDFSKPVKQKPRKHLSKITPAEAQRIKELMSQGKSNRQIAEEIGRPEGSVKRYVREIKNGGLD